MMVHCRTVGDPKQGVALTRDEPAALLNFEKVTSASPTLTRSAVHRAAAGA